MLTSHYRPPPKEDYNQNMNKHYSLVLLAVVATVVFGFISFSMLSSVPKANGLTTAPLFYDSSGNQISSITCGGIYSYDVPGRYALGETYWLNQTKNNITSYIGNYNFPTASYTSVCGRDEGTYHNIIYSLDSNGNKTLYGSSDFTILPVTCSLSVSKNQINVGDKITWTLNINQSGYNSYWYGTKNSATDVSGASTGLPSFSGFYNWVSDPYSADLVGNYSRYVLFQNSAGAVCITNSVSTSVIQSSISTPTPTPTQVSVLMITRPAYPNTTLPNGYADQDYSYQFAASGGTMPYTWSFVTPYETTVANINSQTGLFSISSQPVGYYSTNVKVTDSTGKTYSGNYSFTILPSLSSTPTPTLTPTLMPCASSGAGPAVTVLSPNGSETFELGEHIQIRWKRNWLPCDSNGDVRIFYNTGGLNQELTGGFSQGVYGYANDNYGFAVDTKLLGLGNNFKIVVTSRGFSGSSTSSLSDESDGIFSIILSTPTQTVYPTPTISPIPTNFPRSPVNPNKTYQLDEIYDGDIIRGQGDIAVWIVKVVGEKRFKRWLFGPQIFQAYGHLGFNKVKNVSKETLSHFDSVVLIRKDDDQKVYELTDYIPGVSATRRWVPSAEIFLQRGFDFDSIYIVNEKEYNFYKEGQSLQTSSTGQNSPNRNQGLTANLSDAMLRFLGLK